MSTTARIDHVSLKKTKTRITESVDSRSVRRATFVTSELGRRYRSKLIKRSLSSSDTYIHHRNRAGKPLPEPGKSSFSVSHGRHVSGVIVGLPYQSIGFDVLDTVPPCWMRIAERLFRSDEYKYVLDYGPFGFQWIWTRKEAVCKSLGRSLFDVISTVNVLDETSIWKKREVRLYTRSISINEHEVVFSWAIESRRKALQRK